MQFIPPKNQNSIFYWKMLILLILKELLHNFQDYQIN